MEASLLFTLPATQGGCVSPQPHHFDFWVVCFRNLLLFLDFEPTQNLSEVFLMLDCQHWYSVSNLEWGLVDSKEHSRCLV